MGRTMLGLIILGALALLTILIPFAGNAEAYKPRLADPYKWCAVYGGDDSGGPNCGFYTWEQCMQTAHGLGGFCQESLWYTGPAAPPARKQRKNK